MHPRCRPARYVVHAGQDDERQEHRVETSPQIRRRGSQCGCYGFEQRFALQRNHLRGGYQKSAPCGARKSRPKAAWVTPVSQNTGLTCLVFAYLVELVLNHKGHANVVAERLPSIGVIWNKQSPCIIRALGPRVTRE